LRLLGVEFQADIAVLDSHNPRAEVIAERIGVDAEDSEAAEAMGFMGDLLARAGVMSDVFTGASSCAGSLQGQ
jgi:hypothetical protein